MGLKIKSLESGGILNIAKYLLSNTTGHAELDNCEINDFVAFTELVIHAFQNLNNHEAFFKGNITSFNVNTSSNLKKPAKDKTYIATLRNSTGLSRSDLLIISWMKVAEIGSLRLRSRSLMRVKGSYLQDHSVYSSISCRCCCFFGY